METRTGRALALDGERAAVLCGGAVHTGDLRDPASWTVLCPGATGVY